MLFFDSFLIDTYRFTTRDRASTGRSPFWASRLAQAPCIGPFPQEVRTAKICEMSHTYTHSLPFFLYIYINVHKTYSTRSKLQRYKNSVHLRTQLLHKRPKFVLNGLGLAREAERNQRAEQITHIVYINFFLAKGARV